MCYYYSKKQAISLAFRKILVKKPFALSKEGLEIQPVIIKFFAPGKEIWAMPSADYVHFSTVLVQVIPAINVPLPLMHHFVCKCVHEPLWAKPFVGQPNIALCAGIFLSIIPTTCAPSWAQASRGDFGFA